MKKKLIILFIAILLIPTLVNAGEYTLNYTSVDSGLVPQSTDLTWSTTGAAHSDYAGYNIVPFDFAGDKVYCIDPHISYDGTPNAYSREQITGPIAAGYASILTSGEKDEFITTALRIFVYFADPSRKVVMSSRDDFYYQMKQIYNFAKTNEYVKNAGKDKTGTYATEYNNNIKLISTSIYTEDEDTLKNSSLKTTGNADQIIAKLISNALDAADSGSSSSGGVKVTSIVLDPNSETEELTATSTVKSTGFAGQVTCKYVSLNTDVIGSDSIPYDLSSGSEETISFKAKYTPGETPEATITCTYDGGEAVYLYSTGSTDQRFVGIDDGTGEATNTASIATPINETPGKCDPYNFDCSDTLTGKCSNDSKYTEGFDSSGQENFKECMGKDYADNSLESTEAETKAGILNNKYCKIYCKEDYYFKFPGSIAVKAGTYFNIDGTRIYSDDTNTSNRTCYFYTLKNTFKADYTNNLNIITAGNTNLASLVTVYNNSVSCEEEYTNKVSTATTEEDRIAFQAEADRCNTTKTETYEQINTLKAEMNQAIQNISDAITEISSCNTTETEFNFSWDLNPELKYYYYEPQSSSNKWIDKALEASNDNDVMTIDTTHKNIDTSYTEYTDGTYSTEKTESQPQTTETLDIYTCPEGTELCTKTETKTVTYYYSKSKKSLHSGSYVSFASKKVYYNNHINGEITLTQISSDYELVNGLPVGFDTAPGEYFYTITVNKLGYLSDYTEGNTDELGRIYDSTYSNTSGEALEDSMATSCKIEIKYDEENTHTQKANEYACTYIVNDGTYCVINGTDYCVCSQNTYDSEKCTCYDSSSDLEAKTKAVELSDNDSGCDKYCYLDGSGNYYECSYKDGVGYTPGVIPDISAYCKPINKQAAGCYSEGNCNEHTCTFISFPTEITKVTGTSSSRLYNVDFRTISTHDVVPNESSRTVGYNWDTSKTTTSLSARKASDTIKEIEERSSSSAATTTSDGKNIEYTKYGSEDYTNFKVKLTADDINWIKQQFTDESGNEQSYDSGNNLNCQSIIAADVTTKDDCEQNYAGSGYIWNDAIESDTNEKCEMPNIICYSTFIDELIARINTKNVYYGNRSATAAAEAYVHPYISTSESDTYKLDSSTEDDGYNTATIDDYWTIYQNISLNTNHAGPSWK